MTRQLRLTGRGRGAVVASAAAVAAGMALASTALLAAGAFGLALTATAGTWVLLLRAGASVRRVDPPSTAPLGAPITAIAEVDLARTGATAALVCELLPRWSVPQSDASATRALVRPQRGRGRAIATFTAQERGVHVWPRLLLQLPDPFGIACGLVSDRASARTAVFPHVELLTSLPDPSAAAGPGDHLPARSARRRVGRAGTADSTPRAYVPGDDLRRMHWPATARAGEPMVRTEDAEPARRAVVALDCATASYRDGESFERAVTAAASIAAHLLTEQWAVALQTPGGSALTAPAWQQGPVGRSAILTALAAAELEQQPASALAEGPPREWRCIVTGGQSITGAARNDLEVRTEPVRTAPARSRTGLVALWDGTAPLSAALHEAQTRADAGGAVPEGRRVP